MHFNWLYYILDCSHPLPEVSRQYIWDLASYQAVNFPTLKVTTTDYDRCLNRVLTSVKYLKSLGGYWLLKVAGWPLTSDQAPSTLENKHKVIFHVCKLLLTGCPSKCKQGWSHSRTAAWWGTCLVISAWRNTLCWYREDIILAKLPEDSFD